LTRTQSRGQDWSVNLQVGTIWQGTRAAGLHKKGRGQVRMISVDYQKGGEGSSDREEMNQIRSAQEASWRP